MWSHASGMPVALLVALVLCLGVGTASASRGIGVETGGRPFTLSSERVTFEASGASVSCPITLSGSFASRFAKAEHIAPGKIMSATLPERSCTGGTVRLLAETLPWYVTYYSFTGTLPRISALNLGLDELSGLVEVLGIGCLFEGVARGTTSGSPSVTELRLDATVRIPLLRGLSIFCPREGTVAGTLRASPTLRMSLVESFAAGSTLNAEPNPVRIPVGDDSASLTLTAVGGSVHTIAVGVEIDAGRPRFTSRGCDDTMIAQNGTCTVAVFVGNARPSSGKVWITYLDNFGVALVRSVSVVIN
jgi:hypothetical protein